MHDTDEVVDVVVVDDHRMFAESLSRLLADEAGIQVAGVGSTSQQGLALVREHRPRVLLVDYHMPDGDGVALAAEVKGAYPETMVVVLTGDDDDHVLVAAIEAGCSGFLTKDRASSEVADAVRAAAAGEALISPAQLARLLPRLTQTHRTAGPELTEREIEVLRLLAAGTTNKAVADELFLSVNTVRNYVQSILTKLDAHSKLEAVSVAVRRGIIDYPARR